MSWGEAFLWVFLIVCVLGGAWLHIWAKWDEFKERQEKNRRGL